MRNLGAGSDSSAGPPLCVWAAGWAIVFAAAVTNAGAAVPDVKCLFPPGAQRGGTVEITAVGYAGEWPAQLWTNRPGVSVSAAAEKGKFSATVATDAEPGLYLVRLYNAEGAAVPLPFLVGTLPELNEQEPNDSPAKAQKIEGTTCTVNGRLEKRGDADCFAVSLRQGQTLAAAITAHEQLASPMDAVLQIVSTQGSVLAQNDDERGLDPLLAFSVPADGVYLVRLFAFPATPNASINFAGGENFIYRLTLTTGGFLDAALPLAVSRAGPTNVAAYGLNLDDAKHTVAVPPEKESFELFSPDWAGVLTLPVSNYPSLVEAEPNDAAHAQLVHGPAEISGRIDQRGDRDAFRMQLAKGQAREFTLESRRLGYPLDAVLELFDATGKSLARADDSGKQADPQLTFTAPADGDYTVVVSDLFGHGGRRYFYRLSVAPPEPDFSLTVPQHSYVLRPGTTCEIAVAVDRRRGFGGDIDLEVHGLPEGITASAAKSIAKGDTAKSVKLVLTASPSASSGPIQVFGVATEPAARRHAAAFALPSGASLSDVWITVLP